MNLDLDYFASTDIGDRTENQDALAQYARPEGALFVLADGMGGHQGGKLAAESFTKAVVDAAQRYWSGLLDDPQTALEPVLSDAVEHMSAQLQRAHPELDARTTGVVAWITATVTVSAHVGDSRLYLIGKEGVKWHTRDHSMVQLLIDQGEVSSTDAAHHEDQTRLYKSFNRKNDARASVKTLPALAPGEGLLLCTDGFWTQITETEMLSLLDPHAGQRGLDALVGEAVNRAGGHSDNVTAQWIRRR